MTYYEQIGTDSERDSFIGFSFGTSTDAGSPNWKIGQDMLREADGRPIIADRTLVDAIPHGGAQVAYVVEGRVTNLKAQGVGTIGTLIEALEYSMQAGLSRHLLYAQLWHMPRILSQAAMLGMDVTAADDLPDEFDRQSKQIWTRRKALWVPFNTFGSVALRNRWQRQAAETRQKLRGLAD